MDEQSKNICEVFSNFHTTTVNLMLLTHSRIPSDIELPPNKQQGVVSTDKAFIYQMMMRL